MIKLIKVINLDKRPKRFETFLKNISNSNFKNNNIERFSAIDGLDIIDDIKAKKLESDQIFKELSNLDINIPRGELGCLLSHYFVLNEISQNVKLSDDDFVLIFEDDVFFTDHDNGIYFDQIEEFAKTNKVDFLFVAGRWQKHFIPKSINFFEQKSKHFFKRISGQGYDWDRCSPAYICSKNGAREMSLRVLTQFIKIKKWIAIDTIYAQSTKNILSYDFFPHIYYSERDYETDIQGIQLTNKINTSELVF